MLTIAALKERLTAARLAVTVARRAVDSLPLGFPDKESLPNWLQVRAAHEAALKESRLAFDLYMAAKKSA